MYVWSASHLLLLLGSPTVQAMEKTSTIKRTGTAKGMRFTAVSHLHNNDCFENVLFATIHPHCVLLYTALINKL